MLTLMVWWGTFVLEAVILLRCYRNRVLQTYPFFATYLAFVLLSSMSEYVVFKTRSGSTYQYWYWSMEFVRVILGYSVVLEVMERGLESYEGPRRLGRNAGLLVFAFIVGLTTMQWVVRWGLPSLRTSVEVERNLRSAELVLLAVVLGVIFYYRVPIGRNLEGIIIGYGLCVATVVADHALRSYLGERFQSTFSVAAGYSYLCSLMIWLVFLWSYQPNPVPVRPNPLSSDYDALAQRVRKALESTRGHVKRAGS